VLPVGGFVLILSLYILAINFVFM